MTGGDLQGKRMFVGQHLGEQGADEAVWAEEAETSWEEFIDDRFCHDFQLFVRRVMKGSVSPSFREQKEPVMDQTPEQLLGELLVGPRDRALATDEVDCNIVPADAFERLRRGKAGRSYYRITGEVDEV